MLITPPVAMLFLSYIRHWYRSCSFKCLMFVFLIFQGIQLFNKSNVFIFNTFQRNNLFCNRLILSILSLQIKKDQRSGVLSSFTSSVKRRDYIYSLNNSNDRQQMVTLA